MKLTDNVTVSPHVVARAVGEETVILDLQSGTYFGLDPVGARIWQLLEEGAALPAVCDTLVAEFDVTRDVLERDVLALMDQLIEKKLVAPA